MSGGPGEDASPVEKSGTPREKAHRAVLEGDAQELVRLVAESLGEGMDPIALSEDFLISALEKVGDLFEKKTYFLPQVISSAEAVRAAFAILKKSLPVKDEAETDRLLIATVEGDIHDLGKNILRSLLENYGYPVEDMGINVPVGEIVSRVTRGDIGLVGLSALMTTTLPAMEATVRAVKAERPDLPVIVGGAVVTAEYAEKIGADGYAADAPQCVRLVRKLLG